MPVGDPLVPQQPAPAQLRAKRPRAQAERVRGRRRVEGAEDGDEDHDAPPAKRSRRVMKTRREKVDSEDSSEKVRRAVKKRAVLGKTARKRTVKVNTATPGNRASEKAAKGKMHTVTMLP